MDFRPEFKKEGRSSNDSLPFHSLHHFVSKDSYSNKFISSSLSPQLSIDSSTFTNLRTGNLFIMLLDQLLKNGTYELKAELGKGVFSNVHKAINRHTGENVVIKIYKSSKVNYILHANEEVKILKYLSGVDKDGEAFGRIKANSSSFIR
jgi:hypothetical protein